MLHQLEPLYNKLGWDITNDEDILRTMAQYRVLSWACKLGLTDCIIRAKTLFESWKSAIKTGIENPYAYSNLIYMTSQIINSISVLIQIGVRSFTVWP